MTAAVDAVLVAVVAVVVGGAVRGRALRRADSRDRRVMRRRRRALDALGVIWQGRAR